MSNQYLSFDVTKQSAPQQLITGRQGDSQLKFVTMLFWDGDKNVPYDLTGKQVVFEALKPDNTHIVDYEGITILDAEAGLARYSFNEQVFSVAGTMQQAFFKITHTDSNNNVIADSTLEVAINILENRVEFGINSKDYLSEYDDLIVKVKKKFDDYAATVQDSIDKANALHDQIVEYTQLINDKAVVLQKDFGSIDDLLPKNGNNLIERINNELTDRFINVTWYGLVGDGETDNANKWDMLVNQFMNTAVDVKNETIKTVTFYFPKGNYYFSRPIWITSGVHLKGYAPRRWYKNSKNNTYTHLMINNTVSTPVLRITGFNEDGSIPKELVQQDGTIAGVSPYFAENVSIEDMTIESSGKTGIGINALNTILSTFRNISLLNFDYGFIGSSMWGSTIENSLMASIGKCGLYLDSYCGGISLKSLSINNNTNSNLISDDLGLGGLAGGKYANRPTGVVIYNLTSTHIDDVIVEHFPVHYKIIKSNSISITNAHSEYSDYATFDIDASRVSVQGGYEWQPNTTGANTFSAINGSYVNVSNYKMIDYWTHPFITDSTSFIKFFDTNIQSSILSNANVTIFRSDDGFNRSIDLVLNFIGADGKPSNSTVYTAKRGNYTKYGRIGQYDFEAEIDTWDSTSDGIVRVALAGPSNYGTLNFELSSRISGATTDVILSGYIETSNQGGGELKYKDGYLTPNILRNYKKIRISGSTIINL